METTLAQLQAMSREEARTSKAYPPGTIGVISADLARYPLFSMSLLNTKYPWGSDVAWRSGADIVNNCNRLVKEFTGDWLWILGDDHAWHGDTLLQLLERMYGPDQCDMVASYCLGRRAPFPTVAGQLNETARTVTVCRTADIKGLTMVDVVGSAGLLVRRRVFDAVGYPWFEAGSLVRDGLGEDWKFCINARKAGFKLYVDEDAKMGHMVSGVLWPWREGDKSGAVIDFGDKFQLKIEHQMTQDRVIQMASVD